MAFPSGSHVGPYEILNLLGTGGMGEVYRAHDRRLARNIALKVIRRALVLDTDSPRADTGDDAIDRLLREATLASALNHPNIVTIYETGVVGTDRYVAMELVEGATLRKVAAGGVPLNRGVAIARQIAEALAVAHGAQIVHRDIKPDNVMVRPDGYVKLLDFGLARLHGRSVAAGSTGPVTQPGAIIGTIGYMAPEQARGEPVAPEADVFAFGVLLYELVTGRHPFLAASQLGTLHALMWETPEPPSLLNPDVPRSLDQLIVEMLHKDPRLRPGAGEVLYRLAMANDASVATALSSMTVARGTRTSRTVVGRDLEMDALLHEFERAQQGHGRTVVLSAEAGFGKTTLLDAFMRLLEERGESVRVGRGRCSERLAGSEAYLPVLEILDSLQRSEQLGNISRVIRALAPSWYVQIMPPSASDSSAARLATDTAGGSQERLKREIAALLDEISRLHPVVLCVDDVHWADPSTTDLLGYLARRIEDKSILLLVTARPSDLAQARHPFLSLKLDLVAHGMAREIHPGYLDESAIARYLLLQFPDHDFPRGFASMIHQRTEGHPLFVADLLRDLRRRQVLRQQDGRWIVAEDLASVEREIPESVRSLVQRKMDALDETDRRLLVTASVQGIDFDTAILSAALERTEEDVEDRLERLEREHALVRFVDEWETPDRQLALRYRFAHHLYHNAFDQSLRATRRAALSRTMANLLIARFGDRPSDSAADIALLLESAREPIRAAEYWNRAAQAAARLYAHEETARLALRGLALLEREPSSPHRAAAELDLQMTYGLAIKTSQGYAIPEVGKAYARARELCGQIEDPARVVPVLIGLAGHHVVSGEIRALHGVGLEMLDLFNRLGDPNLQMLGEWSVGAAFFHLGDLETGHAHLLRGLDLYDPSFHRARVWETGVDPGIFCRCELARTFTLLGYPDQGLACAKEAVAQARSLSHPQALAFSLLFTALVHLTRRQPAEVCEVYAELSAHCRRHGIAQEMLWATPLCGRALVEIGEVTQGLELLAQGLDAHIATRSMLLRPFFFILHAGALLRAGRLDAAEHALEESRVVAEATSQHAYDAEHRRLLAVVETARGDVDRAMMHYEEALSIARSQNARWFELRAARGRASLLIEAQQPEEARQALQVCDWFTEGRETLDFVYADGLRKTL